MGDPLLLAGVPSGLDVDVWVGVFAGGAAWFDVFESEFFVDVFVGDGGLLCCHWLFPPVVV